MSLSLLAQLLMIDKDCWNLVPPMPTTSAISWLTEITIWGTHKREPINSPSRDAPGSAPDLGYDVHGDGATGNLRAGVAPVWETASKSSPTRFQELFQKVTLLSLLLLFVQQNAGQASVEGWEADEPVSLG